MRQGLGNLILAAFLFSTSIIEMKIVIDHSIEIGNQITDKSCHIQELYTIRKFVVHMNTDF